MKKNGISQKRASKPTERKMIQFDKIPFEIEDNAGAAKVWLRYSDHFSKIGIQEVDIPLLCAFCVELSNYWHCQKILSEGGLTYESGNHIMVPKPEIKISRDSLSAAIRAGSKFGLLTLDRQKLDGTQAETQETPASLVMKQLQNSKR